MKMYDETECTLLPINLSTDCHKETPFKLIRISNDNKNDPFNPIEVDKKFCAVELKLSIPLEDLDVCIIKLLNSFLCMVNVMNLDLWN